MNLFNGENILSEGEVRYITLTTHRIRKEFSRWGQVNTTSLMLEDITSCEFIKESKPIFLYLGLILGIFGGVLASTEPNISSDLELIIGGSIILTILFLLYYSFSIRRIICISSPTAKIVVNVRRAKGNDILSFIDKVEQAKINKKQNNL